MKYAQVRDIDCVGCGKCIPACPVDAIVGAPQFLHGILTEECIGCGLCLPPCPMDCIEIVENPIADDPETKARRATQAKRRYQARQKRLLANAPKQLPFPQDATEKANIQNAIKEAVNRVQQKRAAKTNSPTMQ